jgi:hypothetical protein
LQKTYNRMGRFWNLGQKKPLKYEIGDFVILKGTNLKTRRSSKALDNQIPGTILSRKSNYSDGNLGDPPKVMGDL